MKGLEIIRNITKTKMPDKEQVRRNCVHQTAGTGPSRKAWLIGGISAAAIVCGVVAVIVLAIGNNGINSLSQGANDQPNTSNGETPGDITMPEIENSANPETTINNDNPLSENTPGDTNGPGTDTGNNGTGETTPTVTSITYTIENTLMAFDSRYTDRGVYPQAETLAGSWNYTIAMGEKPSGGYAISIESVTIDDRGNVDVLVSEKAPNQGEMAIMALTYPICRLTLSSKAESIVIRTSAGEVFKIH